MISSKALPSELLKLPVKIGNNEILAMIDTGSNDSFILYELAQSLQLIIDTDNTKDIIGFGNGKVKTIGTASSDMSIADKVLHCKLHVLSQLNNSAKIIIGADFLKEKEITINVKEKKLQVGRSDKENYCFYINTNNEVNNVQKFNVPVIAAKDYKIDKNTTTVIDINTPAGQHHAELYFEGKNKDNLFYICGVINKDCNKIMVENKGNNKGVIKKGEVVGSVSTCMEGEEEYQEEQWSLEKIKEVVKLENLTEDEQSQVHEMLFSTSEALSINDNDIGKAKNTPHHIQLNDYTPIWIKHRHFPKPIEDEMEAQCRDLLANDIIEYSNSNWSAPCVPVRKSDGSLRLCIDYRKLNNVTQAENFPMPNLNNCLYKAHKMKYFTKIDLVKGYYQVSLDNDSKPLTAFSTTNNHYQFKRLPFGLKNSGIAFQKMMKHVLAPLKTSNIQVYIDDVLIISSNFQEHLSHVKKVLSTLRNYGIKIKVKKCEFFRPEISFLGHILSSNGIQKSQEYIKKVTEYQKPNTVKEMRKFLGLINFQRKFISKCSEICKPLTELMKKPDKMKIEWSNTREEAFNKLKSEVEKDIILTYPDYSENAQKLELYVDASDNGAGACLMQNQGDNYKVIGYNSMCFSQTQKNYSTTERELAAVRWGCEVFKPFIYGIPFLLFTDHRPLIFMFNMTANSSRIYRTLEELSQYNFEIKYLPGTLNEAADFLSRIENYEEDLDNCIEDGIPGELRILKRVEGGGNSMFESVLEALRDLEDDSLVLPENHLKMREEVVSELLRNIKKYKLLDTKHEKNRLKLMSKNNQFPCSEALLAAAKLYAVEIRVYHNIKVPVIYNDDGIVKRSINLQCIGYCHYNPLYARKSSIIENNERYINVIGTDDCNEECIDEPLEVDITHETKDMQHDTSCCYHDVHNVHLISKYNSYNICSIVDTGSQVSIIGSDTWEMIQTGNEIMEMEEVTLKSFDGQKHKSSAIVNLKIHMGDYELPRIFPFCIVDQDNLPSCILLGINFLEHFNVSIDFKRNNMIIDNNINIQLQVSRFNHRLVTIEVEDNQEDESTDEQDVQFVISLDELRILQSSSKVLRDLKYNISRDISTKQWKTPALNQFKRYKQEMSVNKDILMRNKGKKESVVITYPFLVEVLSKVHSRVAHMGRHKLMELTSRQFWHPAMEKVAREICRCCNYCQLNKVNIQHEKPPILKINSINPFQLVSMDLVALPITSQRNIAALVVIDHNSKWLTAVPVKNKSSTTISRILKYQILPNMIKIPVSILSDNGLEFKGRETEEVLKEFNIKHLYSSPYTPTGNGAVERVNRTLIGILKSLTDDLGKWDEILNKALIMYNNSYHSQISCSPAEYLMGKIHKPSTQMLLDEQTVEHWREGHPNFEPFAVGQKVIKLISYIGNRTSTKMKPKYEGPYLVKKVQNNGLSYEIAREEDSSNVIKCNHRKLRGYKELPWSIKRFLPDVDESTTECDDIMPNVITDSSSSESSFEGFSSESECSSDSSAETESSTSMSTDESSDQSESISGKMVRYYNDVKYSDKTNSVKYMHSSPNPNIDKDFIEFLECTSFREALPVMEQTINSQIELLMMSEEKLSDLTILLNKTTDDLNTAMLMSKSDMVDGDEYFDASREFDGFISEKNVTTAQHSVNQLKAILQTCRSKLKAGRTRSQNVQKEMWQYRQNKSLNSTYFKSFEEAASLINEVDDTIGELNPISASTPRRILRSQGKAPEYPTIQPRTLEYKLRKTRLNV